MVVVKSQKKNTVVLKETTKNEVNNSSIQNTIKKKLPRIIGKREGNEEVLDLLESLIDNHKNNSEIKYHKPVSDKTLKVLRDDLHRNFSKEVLTAPNDDRVREKLVEIVLRNHRSSVNGSSEAAEYVVREIVGTGVIEKLLENDSITDVGWNGILLSIKTNDDYLLIKGEDLGITKEYIESVISKYAVANDANFNSGNTIFDGMYKNIRINAVHEDNSPSGATLSLRRAKPQLALNKSNFRNFAPDYILELFEHMVLAKSNIVISGDTGTGKTELQKLLLSFITHENKVIMIEDVQETHAQTLFPDLEVYSWLTSPGVSIDDLVVAALRNTPDYLIVSETRGKEAYQMFMGILADQCIITTLHSKNARATPRRYVGMCSSGYQVNEQSLEEDINKYFDFDFHIKKIRINGKMHRYLNEVLEFNENGGETIFEQKFINGEFVVTKIGKLSEEFNQNLSELFRSFEFPKDIKIYGKEVENPEVISPDSEEVGDLGE